jgi:hypothetical protein
MKRYRMVIGRLNEGNSYTEGRGKRRVLQIESVMRAQDGCTRQRRSHSSKRAGGAGFASGFFGRKSRQAAPWPDASMAMLALLQPRLPSASLFTNWPRSI